jgi:predicted flap endonuclease-1-like 5' DNA nuclease
MDSIFSSPLYPYLLLLTGFLVGWLLRQAMLLRQFNARLNQTERDRNLARTETENLHTQLSLKEADLKKALFELSQTTDQLEISESERVFAVKNMAENRKLGEKWVVEKSELSLKIIAQEEQIDGLRARLLQISEQADQLSDQEAAEKRIHNDFSAALKRATELQLQVDNLEKETVHFQHQHESLKTQLLDYQLKTIDLPGLLDVNAIKNTSKKRSKKSAGQPTETAAATFAAAPAEDLKIINTIEVDQESELHKLGITTIQQLAKLTDAQVLEIAEGSSRLVEQLRAEKWVAQAQHLLGAQA